MLANALKKSERERGGVAWSRKRRKDGGRMKVFDNKPAAGSPLLNFYWRRRVNLRLNPPLVTLPRAIAPTRVRQLVWRRDTSFYLVFSSLLSLFFPPPPIALENGQIETSQEDDGKWRIGAISIDGEVDGWDFLAKTTLEIILSVNLIP